MEIVPSFLEPKMPGPSSPCASFALGEPSWSIPSLDAWVGLGAGGPWATMGWGWNFSRAIERMTYTVA